MVDSRQIVNVIVEEVLRPQLENPRKDEDSSHFIYSDSIDISDTDLKIGVSKNNKNPGEMKRLGSLEKYEITRIQVDVQVPINHSSQAFRENFEWPVNWVEKPEDAIDWMAGQVEDLVVDEADKDKENSKIRSIGGPDCDVVLQHDQTVRVPINNSTERQRVFFLAAHE